MRRALRQLIPVLLALMAAMSACTVNPVTGQRQLALVSADQEIAIGREQYVPARQMQGGDYVRDPALNRYVSDIGQRLAAVSDRALPYEFVVLNSSVPNAWALPGGKIAVNRGLLVELDSEAELAAVLGHEIVHAAARHGALAMQRGMLLQGAVLIATAASRSGDHSGVAVGAAGLGAQLINQRNSREAELESDRYGMEYMARAGFDPSAAVTLQQTFTRLAAERTSTGWLAGLFASHPPSAERVERNRANAAALGTRGDIGRDRYRAAIAGLVQARPAYDAYDEGRAALEAGDFDEAERLGNAAIALISDEGHFHALLGDIDYARENYAAADRHFSDAISRNGNFFYHYLRRGLSRQSRREWTAARTAFTASIRLLPTADAYLGLGQIAEELGERESALANYRLAAEGSTGTSQQAQDSIVRLDLPVNPNDYLVLGSSLDTNGRLIVEIRNPTRLAVNALGLAVIYADNSGQIQRVRRTLPDVIAGGATRRFALELGSQVVGRPVEVSIDAARVVNP